MNILVTGAAGFIGSHLCERLLQDEQTHVIGIDGFIDSSTPRRNRQFNLQVLSGHPRFIFHELDLLNASMIELLDGVDGVCHLAGMPGVRSSWGPEFSAYAAHNIVATQRLLEGCKRHPVRKFIYASTSSVYGEQSGRVDESAKTDPLSPYGVSKLTGEHLCRVYLHNDGIPVTVLRFFTVYGPRQRPDMAFHRFIRQMLQGNPITLYGDGSQTRDFTYVSDCVEGIASTVYADGIRGEILNIGGRERASVKTCIMLLEEQLQQKTAIQYAGDTYGEPRHTWADIAKAQSLLGYHPRISLQAGLAAEIEALRQLYP